MIKLYPFIFTDAVSPGITWLKQRTAMKYVVNRTLIIKGHSFSKKGNKSDCEYKQEV